MRSLTRIISLGLFAISLTLKSLLKNVTTKRCLFGLSPCFQMSVHCSADVQKLLGCMSRGKGSAFNSSKSCHCLVSRPAPGREYGHQYSSGSGGKGGVGSERDAERRKQGSKRTPTGRKESASVPGNIRCEHPPCTAYKPGVEIYVFFYHIVLTCKPMIIFWVSKEIKFRKENKKSCPC